MNRKLSRIQRDLEQLTESPQPGIAVWPVSELNVEELSARLTGPENSPFAGGSFYLSIKFPDRYPFEPPHLTFKTRIYHPNIDAQGRICLELLKMPPQGLWKPHMNLSSVLTSILILMAEPNPNDPLDAEVAEEFKSNRTLFENNARQMTKRYASDDQNEVKIAYGTSLKLDPVVMHNENASKSEGSIATKDMKADGKKTLTAPNERQDAKTTNLQNGSYKPNPFAALGKKPKLN